MTTPSELERPSVGAYVHVPFCERICPYCDFPVVAARSLTRAEEDRYVAALLGELAGRAVDFAGRALDTIYFGGGTPSLLRPDSLARVIEALRGAFPGEPREVTLEANPSTTERERLPAFRAAGVNRLSLGIQSFDDDTLRRLGRAHRARECHEAIGAARDAGFENLSLDLIFGAPGQTEAALRRDLTAALARRPEHVSAYALTLEPGTPFARAVAADKLEVPEDDAAAEMMLALGERLEAAGLARYEISSWAQPGRESLHNRRYWQRRPVLGLGVGAHSTEPAREGAPHGARSANERALGQYLERIEAGHSAPPEREALSEATARAEAVFLALRMREGLGAAAFAAEFGAAPRAYFSAAIEGARAEGLVAENEAGDLALTERGWLFADDVAARFV
ncbi:MAG: radical SAM family heme chaperone HemW [Deltaproteobacteria bacterium]|nr:radical SAM family heme chaperone HemW [Deltaproteobacteria bacterium]